MARKRAKGRGRKATPPRARAKTRGRKASRPSKASKSTKPARRTSPARKAKRAVKAQPKAQARTRARAKAARKPQPREKTAAAQVPPGRPRHPPALERERRRLHEVEDNIPTPPSSLDLDRTPSAARSGRREMREARLQHNETSPELTGGDVDADWEDAYAVGDEAPGGDNPTPDQDRVDDIGKALGVQYEDSEELKSGDKISQRDRHRWELDPASAEDYPEHEE